jgi:hypothetical protein
VVLVVEVHTAAARVALELLGKEIAEVMQTLQMVLAAAVEVLVRRVEM